MSILNSKYPNSLHHFCIVGINYRKSDSNVRGQFSLSPDQSRILLQQSLAKKISGCFVLSTCNRTEIYGICQDPGELIEMLCENTNNVTKDFLTEGYSHIGIPAIKHLFKVASGLDSQITGDSEILAQLKLAAKIAKQHGCINSIMERIINFVLQASKDIRTKTRLNSGTVSVSYAAIEIIKEKIKDVTGRKILLVGTGKFGTQIAKNLKEYLPESFVALTNRTEEKAFNLSLKYNTKFIAYHKLRSACEDADVIIVNSSAESYTILPSFFTTVKPRLILDLSIPQNVHPDVRNINGISLMNVDEVSQIPNKTIALRQSEVSKAMYIIDKTMDSLMAWSRQQSDIPLLHQVKSQLYQLSETYPEHNFKEEKIQKAVSSLAVHLKYKTNKGCQCINALNFYLQMNDEPAS